MNTSARAATVTEKRQDPATESPVPGLYERVVGQADAIAQLRAASRRPVHAYMLVGPRGLSQRPLVRGFAASLLCRKGGCGACDVCRRALEGTHPDLVEVERAGPAVTVDEARRVVRLAQRRPLEGHRQVIVVGDVHLARLSAPVLLKTLEEPAEQTVFVMLSESVPAELATIASRCVRIDLQPLSAGEIAAWLESEGVDALRAREVADSAGGNAERARLLARDEGFAARRELWRSVPARLDGTGAAAAALAAELLASCEDAVEPLRAIHRAEVDSLAEEAEALGTRGPSGAKQLEDRQRREERRWRTDELRAGLAVLAGAYRDRLTQAVGATSMSGAHNRERLRALTGAIEAIESAVVELVRNPNETLMLEALLVRLSAVTA